MDAPFSVADKRTLERGGNLTDAKRAWLEIQDVLDRYYLPDIYFNRERHGHSGDNKAKSAPCLAELCRLHFSSINQMLPVFSAYIGFASSGRHCLRCCYSGKFRRGNSKEKAFALKE